VIGQESSASDHLPEVDVDGQDRDPADDDAGRHCGFQARNDHDEDGQQEEREENDAHHLNKIDPCRLKKRFWSQQYQLVKDKY